MKHYMISLIHFKKNIKHKDSLRDTLLYKGTYSICYYTVG